MNILLTVQMIAKTDVEDPSLQKQLGPVRSALDSVCETACHNHGILKYYCPGELCDAPNAPAARYLAVLHLGKQRAQALHQLMTNLQPHLETLLPSCTIQWKVESLDFLNH